MQGNAGNLSQADVTANKNFLGNMQFSPNNPYAMTSGPFKGMNAPGTSAFGSKTPKEMAQKWVKRYGDIEREKNSPMARKSQAMKNMATMNEAPPGKATGGIMRLGYAQGNPHQDQQDVQGPAHLSHNAPVDRGPAHLSHNAPSGGGNNQGPRIGPVIDKGANIAKTVLPFLNPKNANILSMGLGLKGLYDTWQNRDNNLNTGDMIYGVGNNQSSLDNNNVSGQLMADISQADIDAFLDNSAMFENLDNDTVSTIISDKTGNKTLTPNDVGIIRKYKDKTRTTGKFVV